MSFSASIAGGVLEYGGGSLPTLLAQRRNLVRPSFLRMLLDIRRFNQARASGCVDAEFTVVTGLADELKVGLFQQPRSYSAWIRFANATSASDRENRKQLRLI